MRTGLKIMKGALLAAVAALTLAAAAPEAQAACRGPNYCKEPGACLTIGQVKRQVASAYGREGWRVARVRLVGRAPTPSCLWYEVMLSHPKQRGGKLIYWGVRGGRVG